MANLSWVFTDACKIVGYRGVRGAVLFGFEAKSHPNRKINKYAVWFGSVDF